MSDSKWSRMQEIERHLGFRVTPRGVEVISSTEDGIIVKAVQPTLALVNAQKLWEALLAMDKERELAKREKEYWAAKAFEEKENADSLKKRLPVVNPQGS